MIKVIAWNFLIKLNVQKMRHVLLFSGNNSVQFVVLTQCTRVTNTDYYGRQRPVVVNRPTIFGQTGRRVMTFDIGL